MWVLCDINAAYVSFCQLFNPQYDFDKTPLGVLSSNQGNIVARNQAIKDLGIKMGEPAFKVKQLVAAHGGHLWGSNFTLFGDLSNRFHTELEYFLFDTMRYSVDECFGRIDTNYTKDIKEYAHTIQRTLKRNLGIGCGLGISQTMTLAKLGSHCAKKKEWKAHTQGVVVLDSQHKIDWALKHTAVEDIWGVGSRTKKKLNQLGIYSGYDLKSADISWIKKTFNVVLARTVEELQGKPAVELKDINDSRDRICVSQSMGKPVTELFELAEAVTAHTTKAAFKLRRFNSYTSAITIFIHTDSFRQTEPQYHKSQSIKLPYPTADTSILVAYASYALKAIFKKGYKYKKAGVIFESLALQSDMQQLELLSETPSLSVNTKTRVMDEINRKFGHNAIKIASEGCTQSWRPKDNLAPMSYTTNISELPIAKAR